LPIQLNAKHVVFPLESVYGYNSLVSQISLIFRPESEVISDRKNQKARLKALIILLILAESSLEMTKRGFPRVWRRWLTLVPF